MSHTGPPFEYGQEESYNDGHDGEMTFFLWDLNCTSQSNGRSMGMYALSLHNLQRICSVLVGTSINLRKFLLKLGDHINVCLAHLDQHLKHETAICSRRC